MRKLATICMILAAAPPLLAQPTLVADPYEAKLRSVPIPELPLLAALFVNQAKPEERPATATNVVKAAVRIAPAACLAVVSEMARSRPETASIVACVLAVEQPSLIPNICRAAVAGAPTHTRDIVVSIGRAVPNDYRTLALAAAEGAPSSGRAIVRAIATLRPELEPYLELEWKNVGSAPGSVVRCLDHAERAQKRAMMDLGAEPDVTGVARPEAQPSAQPPDHADQKPPKGGWGPPGGRNYAKP